MIRLILAILMTVTLVVFAMANSHHIEMSLVFGRPARIRLIFLLASSYLLGILTAAIGVALRDAQRKWERRRASDLPADLPPYDDAPPSRRTGR